MNIREIRPILVWLYPVGVILIIATVLQPALRIWPVRFGDVGWRFGAVGLLADTAAGVLFGLGWLLLVAAVLDHRLVARIVSVIAIVLGVCAVGVLGFFALDFLQLRGDVRPEMLGGFTVAAGQATLLLTLSGISALALGIAGWKSSRRRVGTGDESQSGLLLQQRKVQSGGRA